MYNCSTIKAKRSYSDPNKACPVSIFLWHSGIFCVRKTFFKRPLPAFSYYLSITVNIISTCHKPKEKIITFFLQPLQKTPQNIEDSDHLSVMIKSSLCMTKSRCAAYLTVYETEFNLRTQKRGCRDN